MVRIRYSGQGDDSRNILAFRILKESGYEPDIIRTDFEKNGKYLSTFVYQDESKELSRDKLVEMLSELNFDNDKIFMA
ncbi:MAG: hypothetical protein OQK82_08845 [Candidatus Pacearchaeota archaeon]|nr:hypothetical protein [Candidatus Pacearchaeota archaeon]